MREGLGLRGAAPALACVAAMVAIATWLGCNGRERGHAFLSTSSSAWGTASELAARDEALAKKLAATELVEDRHGGAVARAWVNEAKAQGLTFGAHVPSFASGAIDVGLATAAESRAMSGGDYVLRVTHEGFSASPLVNDGGRASYRDVAPATDLLVSAGGESTEWLYLLKGAAAPSHFAMHVALPKGLARVEAQRDGSLSFRDGRGVARLTMPRAHAVDAYGTRRDVALVWDAARARIDATLDVQGLTYPILVDPSVAHSYWEQAPFAQPISTNEATLPFDSARGETILFTSYYVGNTPSAFTWEWNGTTWTKRSPVASPSPRIRSALAYDAARAKTILFSGIEVEGYAGDNQTWQWDGTNWTQASPATSPSARCGASIAYDSKRARLVLYGGDVVGTYGCGGGAETNETWQWDGTTWTQLHPAASPPATQNAPMVYDSARDRMVIVMTRGPGGEYFEPAETWEFDGTTWSQSASANAPPSGMAAYDAATGKTVLFGAGQGEPNANGTWEWDGTSWTSPTPARSPTLRIQGSMAYDSIRARVVLFGGPDEREEVELNDTWEWDGTTWAEKMGSDTPVPPRADASPVYDSAHALTLIFGGTYTGSGCGEDGCSPDFFNDTLGWDGTSWKTLSASGPPARADASIAYDDVRQRLVLFGGGDSSGALLDDTWEWDGTTWTQRTPAKSPPASQYVPAIFDEAHAQTTLFVALNDLWNWDGTNWSEQTVASSPPARQYPGIVYDRGRSRAVMFGGGTGYPNTAYGDTWEWDGTTWTQRSVSPSPSARYFPSLAYDGDRAKTVLFGGESMSSDGLADTWEWDGTSWTEQTLGVSPYASWGAPGGTDMAYDSSRRQVVLLNDVTWLYFTIASSCTGDATCGSGFCTDGVCCLQAQCGACQSCDLTGHEGTCTNVATGTTPTTGDTNACAAPNLCSASGACVGPLGAACSANSDCYSNFCADGVCCNVACTDDCQACSIAHGATVDGTCATASLASPGKGKCGVYACSGVNTSCTNTCTSDSGCAAGYYCDPHGACVAQKTQGEACDTAAGTTCLLAGCRVCAAVGDAGSGTCVDGVCCDTTCDGSCESCNASGSVGTCTFDAKGSAGSPSCAPFVCSGTGATCTTTCSADSDCASQAFCNPASQQCIGTATKGTPCTSDQACQSAACVQGVCCDKHCGTAASDGGNDVCGVGVCSASTGYMCELPAGIQCRTESCDTTKNQHTFPAVCDGAGNCGKLETQDCSPYTCDVAAADCKTTCASDADCTKGATCSTSNQCVVGATCSSDGTSVVSNSGASTPCSPYVCEANVCATKCTSVKDCATGFSCDANGACVANAGAASTPTNPGACSCDVGPKGGARGAWGFALALLLLTRRRRSLVK